MHELYHIKKTHTFWLTDIKKNMFRYYIDKKEMPRSLMINKLQGKSITGLYINNFNIEICMAFLIKDNY
jgi:hypothetical protein